MNFLAAARPAVTRSDNRRRKPRASTAANDNTWLRAKCQRALCFDSSTSPTTLSASFQLHNDADGGEKQSTTPRFRARRRQDGLLQPASPRPPSRRFLRASLAKKKSPGQRRGLPRGGDHDESERKNRIVGQGSSLTCVLVARPVDYRVFRYCPPHGCAPRYPQIRRRIRESS